ncbi:MAG: acetoacetate--CoA ligase [Gammaproteobacteria bacterium]|nr:acetoacetate--CoA ligase [Gammaproteobacteria bacterium]MYH46373.1 acetoacetate--CoA ligase [Gammaproteobacteria bacterium]MYL14410.1 acetoacetate--CoA ligase [Gammaproteobacteria bacterium]
MSDPLWRPSSARINSSGMQRFARQVENQLGLRFRDYGELHRWSIDNPEIFWEQVWRFGGIISSEPWERVLTDGDRFPGAKWFSGARLNYAENLLRRRDDGTAVIARLENGERRSLSHAQLYEQVGRLAAALRASGIAPGDRVAALMPNVPETLIGMLACASVGAVWSSCSPDFGFAGVMDRFGQISPKVLIACDGYFYNGKRIDCLPRVAEIAGNIDSLEQIVVVPVAGIDADVSRIRNVVSLDDYLPAEDTPELEFEQLPFDHPLYIVYSSGTTGVPKCIVHGAGGTLIQHLKEHRLHVGLGPEDVFFYFTTCGWMMWNWLVSGLASGATLALYDGSPFRPAPSALLDMAQEEGITVFGTSAKYIAALEKEHLRPRETHDLSALRTVLSTGSPLSHESFRYVYRDVKQDVCLSSISGGTDIVSCFVLGNECLPVREGEIQCLGLGMAVEFRNEKGESVIGEKGEMVCARPFPSAPIGFWNDPGDRKYLAAYFDAFPNVWTHGDYGELTEHGGVIIHGRSDAVLNPGGVRIGTAEIYRQVEKLDEIVDSICIGQEWEGDVRVVLFVVPRKGVTLDDELRQRIRQTIRSGATPRHVPAVIVPVADIPRTLSGKIVELAVRNMVHGRPVRNTDALANPEALELFRDLPELRRE